MPGDKRFAVLIDADNISNKYVKVIMDEISNDGVATYKRIYGDWTRAGMGPWKRVLLEHSITPIQQYGYTTGKNATDSAMIIDAMDILYSGNVEGFCLVSSDSDFTRLASRLRESGMMVVGMGEQKTPKAFISACNKFKYLDILSGQAAPKAEAVTKKAANAKNAKNSRMSKAERETALAAERAAAAAEKEALEREAAEKAAEQAEREAASKNAERNERGKKAADKEQPEKQADKDRNGKNTPASRRKGKSAAKEERQAEAEKAQQAAAAEKNSREPEPEAAENRELEAENRELEAETRVSEIDRRETGAAQKPEHVLQKDPKTGKYRPEDMGIILFEEEDIYENEPAEMTSLDTIREAVATIVAESADEDEWVFIGDLGNRLTKRYPDFDVRNYGFKKLTPFIKSLNLFDIKSEPGGNSNNKLVYVRERDSE